MTFEDIYRVVCQIPPGSVASYGEVAKAAGLFRGAQVVGWALRALPPDTDVPWQRVINQKARLSIVNPKIPKTLQMERLEQEGVKVAESDGWLRVEHPIWHLFQ